LDWLRNFYTVDYSFYKELMDPKNINKILTVPPGALKCGSIVKYPKSNGHMKVIKYRQHAHPCCVCVAFCNGLHAMGFTDKAELCHRNLEKSLQEKDQILFFMTLLRKESVYCKKGMKF